MTSQIKQPYSSLYVKTNRGKLKIWYMLVETVTPSEVYVITKYGLKDGKITTKKTKITSTKAGRTFEEEAVEECRKKWEKKVNKECHSQTEREAMNTTIVRPMLAYTYDINNPEKSGIKYPCIADEKCDGNRCIGKYDVVNNCVTLESRNGTPIYHFHHIEKELKKMFSTLNITNISDFRFDGELFTHQIPFNLINGMCNYALDSKSLNRNQIMKMKYYIFDCFDISDLSLTAKERKDRLRKLFKKHDYEHLILIGGKTVTDIDQLKPLHDLYVKKGYEGVILRNMSGVYHMNKRSKDLQKYKVFRDEEFKTIDVEEDANGGPVWTCETNITPKSTFCVKQQGDHEYLKNVLKNSDKYLGKLLIVKFQEFTDDIHGIPRFPVGKAFRNMKDL